MDPKIPERASWIVKVSLDKANENSPAVVNNRAAYMMQSVCAKDNFCREREREILL
jgi:hypothetical protein